MSMEKRNVAEVGRTRCRLCGNKAATLSSDTLCTHCSSVKKTAAQACPPLKSVADKLTDTHR